MKVRSRITRQRVIISAGVDVFKFSRFVVTAFRIHSLEKEAFDFVGSIEGVAFILVEFVGISLEDAAYVGTIRLYRPCR